MIENIRMKEGVKKKPDPISSHIVRVATEHFQNQLAPNCGHRRKTGDGWRCEITGAACEKPWRCPKLRKGGDVT